MKISLIGDSIRMQYESQVREKLGDGFEIFAPTENCRFAKYNLRGMWDWKESMQGSRIVHWNCGLWDICDIFGDGMFTDVDEYVKTVLRVADILLSRYDKVIFATTTPVRSTNTYNDNDEIIKYNKAIVPEGHRQIGFRRSDTSLRGGRSTLCRCCRRDDTSRSGRAWREQ